MNKKRKILITGACGVVSSQLIAEMKKNYDVVLTDIKQPDSPDSIYEGLQLADLVDSNRDNYRHLFEGVDTVIHNAFVGAGTIDVIGAKFELEFANVQMAYNIYQTAWEEDVRRVVMTSSNHAADYYEDLLLDGKLDFIDSNKQNRAFSYYGWAKDSYEHLGFLFALGRMSGRSFSNVQIRIGAPRETDLDAVEPGDLRKMRRALAVYISQRDLVQLYTKSIETESIDDQHGVPFQIFYGISGNTHAFWSLVNAREVIGYDPQDNSEYRFAEKIQRHIAAADHPSH